MEMSWRRIVFFGVALLLLLAACSPQTVEVTRVVEVAGQAETIEVTRLVEVEGETVVETETIEVTRVIEVEAPREPTGTLIVALPLDPNSLNPPNTAERMAENVSNQIFDALLALDLELNELSPALATEWEVSDDGLQYSFTLREGVTFHDGTPFNAEDVVATFEAGADPANAYFDEYIGLTVEVIDDYHVVLVRDEPDVVFERLLAETPIISAEQFAEGGNQAIEDFPIGTGPFKFVEWVKGNRIVLEANRDYWIEGLPLVAEVIFRPISESSTRLAAIQTGEVHIVNRLSSDEARQLLGLPGVQVIRYPVDRVYYIAFNNLTTGVGLPTEDPLVRQAMNYAVDREAIIDGLFDGFADLATGMITPENLGYDASVEPFPYDPDRARELLAEAGYANGFEIGMACPIGAYTNFEEVCQAVAGYLADVGITLAGGEVAFMETGVYWDLEANKELPPLFGDSWSASEGEAYPRLFGSLGGMNASYSAWSDPDIDDYLAQISQEFDRETRAARYGELQQYMMENPPFIYLYVPNSFEAIRDAVQGYRPNAVEAYFLKDVFLAGQ
jgi:peptide/nickel transport system substrate-binding protein